ncbi:DUF2238 domain-containing protein [Paractinoplanes rhizophilus]|uniref:DUF2238 domain-containing protein n=1 Tax=Paractinoplanes rhizophilus TaxID=1416877 RepID=A0ABW2HHK9_9ACTN|nr:DUF2238 domain-containing protein [Actinoplanes sp.]
MPPDDEVAPSDIHSCRCRDVPVIVAVTWRRPLYPAEQAMRHSLTLVGLVALLLVRRARPIPYGSFLLILVFLALQSVAARWIYSFVPYDDWTAALSGVCASRNLSAGSATTSTVPCT